MARSTFRATFKGDENSFEGTVERIASSHGFSLTDYADEIQVWKKNSSVPTITEYIKFELDNNEVIVSAWIMDNALDKGLPGMSLLERAALGVARRVIKDREKNLDGFAAMLPKRMLKKTIKKIIDAIESA